MTIPKIIHRISYPNLNWERKYFPGSIQSWKKYHPDYKHMIWTDNDINVMIKKNFPYLLKKINKIKENDKIMLLDIARLCFLYL